MKLLVYKLFNIALRHDPSYFFILIILSFFLAQAGHADCDRLSYFFTIPNISSNMNNIPLQGKIGSEIISPEQTVTCINDSRVGNRNFNYLDYASNQILGRAIYPTSVPGIGYAVGLEPTNFCTTTTNWIPFATCKVASSQLTFKYKLHLQLFRIGAMSTANNITVSTTHFSLDEFLVNSNALLQSTAMYQSSLPFNMQINTCSVQSSSIVNVTFPTISANSIPSSLSSRVPFSLAVNCPNTTNLNITFTDNNNIGQTTNILTPTATSTAKGVGVQLQYNGKIISFGPDSAEPGTINQIVLNNNLSGIQTFPFTASYVRTGTVTPGTISARATFTLSYQ